MNKFIQNSIKISFFVIITLITIGYSYHQTRAYAQGPILELSEPLNGYSYQSKIVFVKGRAKNISYISLNDRQVFVDELGNLNEKLLLSPGYNIIKVTASDKYDREIVKKIEVVHSAFINNNLIN
ncbi:MAG: hypothetical protein ABIG87_01110 [Patescibacteria group bacterium]